MHGNMHTLGYFSADACVGTPPRKFDLIVDTGSSLTAFPCSGCSHCGSHDGGNRFSEAASSTSEACHSGSCSYSVGYTEGSSIRGRIVYDHFWFGSESGRRPVRAAFGCQTYESGLFYGQMADGIVGFSQRSQHGGTLFDYMRSALHSPDVFSICLSEEEGALVLGGTVPAGLEATWVPFRCGTRG